MPESLAEWLARISALHPSEIELGLTRIRRVAERLLDARPLASKVVTIAGTNGKGSTLAMVERLALDAGLSVMAYTSPHLLRFTERLRVNAVESCEDDWINAFAQVERARSTTPLTYFEFTTLAALWLIQQRQPDLALLEVGMGGRLDAVNIVDPDVALITPVDLDHTDWLGEDREAIGREKAGILRTGIPLVSSDPAVPESVLQVAREQGCPTWLWMRDHRIDASEGGAYWYGSSQPGEGADTQRQLLDFELCPLPPENVSAALQTASLLGVLSENEPLRPWEQLALSGRLQRVSASPEIILDVGHNPQAARFLARWLTDHPVDGRTWALYSALADKAIEEVVSALAECIDGWWVAPIDAERAAPVTRLAEAIRSVGGDCTEASSVGQGVSQLRSLAHPKDRILVFGSFYTVADALSALGA